MTCRNFVEFLMEYLSGELDPAQRVVFEAHLIDCPECVTYLSSYAVTVELGKDAFAELDGGVPADVPEALIKAVLAARTAWN